MTSWLPSVLQLNVLVPATAIIAVASAWSIKTVGDLRAAAARGRSTLEARVAELASLAARQSDEVDKDVLQMALMEVLEPALAALPSTAKREREEPKEEVPWWKRGSMGGSSSGTGGTGASATLGDVDVEECSHEDAALRDDVWYSKQPRSIQLFVKAIDRSKQAASRESGNRDMHSPEIMCMCGVQKRSDHFADHVRSDHPELEGITQASEQHWKDYAECAVTALASAHREIGTLRTQLDTAAAALTAEQLRLREEHTAMQAQLKKLESELCSERIALNYEANCAAISRRLMKKLGPPRALCEVAQLHQQLHERGVFKAPLNATTERLHLETLRRLDLGKEGVRRGGQPVQLSVTSRAKWLYLYNNSRRSAYRMEAAIHGGPRLDYVSTLHRSEFAAVGTSCEFVQRAAQYYCNIGFRPDEHAWQLCYDAAKMKREGKWDPKTNEFIGHIDFSTRLHFTSSADLDDFLENHVLAGYVLIILLCPLDPAIPSAFRVVGVIPTDLTYTQPDLHGYLTDLHDHLRSATAVINGRETPTPFKWLVNEAADNAAVHGAEMLRRALPNVGADEREPGPGLGNVPELCEILTLFGHRLKGDVCPTIQLNDVSHFAKTWTLLLYSMARLMLLGNYPLLGMHLIVVQLYRKASGLFACDSNGSDRMDVGSALRKLNYVVRREMASCPGTFGTAAYLYFGACTTSAYLDRDPDLKPLERVKRCFRNLVFLRYWHAWLGVSNKPAHLHFISFQTYKAALLLDHAMVLLVLLWGMYFPHLPFAPWLSSSDQNEKFFSELRAFVMNKPDFNALDLLSLIRRWTYQTSLLARPDVVLPPAFSTKGYNRSNYRREASADFVQSDHPDATAIKAAYAAIVAEVQPFFVAFGCAEQLKAAGMWATPPLEQWAKIEATIAKEKADGATAEDAAQMEAAAEQQEAAAERAGGEDDEGAGGGGDEERAAEAGADDGDENGLLYEGERRDVPEKIIDHLNAGGRGAEERRKLKVKWKGYTTTLSTFEPVMQLLEDGFAGDPALVRMVYDYLSERNLKLPKALEDYEPEAEDEQGEEATDEDATVPLTPLHPEIPTVDRKQLLAILAEPIGSELPNLHMRAVSLPASATAAQRAQYEVTHVCDPETGDELHKAHVMAVAQKQAADDKPGAGRLSRYMCGVRFAIISDDKEGTGFEYGGVYEMLVGDPGMAGRDGLILEGQLLVTYVRILELRKQCGKVQQLRLSMKKSDASLGTAVVLPFNPRDPVHKQPHNLQLLEVTRTWVAENGDVSPSVRLVPLLELGRKVELSEYTGRWASGASGPVYTCEGADDAVGGPALEPFTLQREWFEAEAMEAVSVDLDCMKVTELAQELEARGAPRTGRKAALQRRLRAVIIAVRREADREEDVGV